MKHHFPIWQITLPICAVLVFGIGSLTTIYMVKGRYVVDLEASPKQLKIRTDMDKREGNISEDQAKQETKEAPESHN